MPHLASQEVSLRSGQDVPPQFVQMVQVRPHDLKKGLYALHGCTGMEKVALNPKCL
jgi:hypothetical protein